MDLKGWAYSRKMDEDWFFIQVNCSIVFFLLIFQVICWEAVAKRLMVIVWGLGLQIKIDICE